MYTWLAYDPFPASLIKAPSNPAHTYLESNSPLSTMGFASRSTGICKRLQIAEIPQELHSNQKVAVVNCMPFLFFFSLT